MPKNKWGLPLHVDEKKLVPDRTRPDHYIFPSPDGDPARDEVYHMPSEFTAQRGDDDTETALEEKGKIRQGVAQDEAKRILEDAQRRADEIVATAQAEADGLKQQGEIQTRANKEGRTLEDQLEYERREAALAEEAKIVDSANSDSAPETRSGAKITRKASTT